MESCKKLTHQLLNNNNNNGNTYIIITYCEYNAMFINRLTLGMFQQVVDEQRVLGEPSYFTEQQVLELMFATQWV